MPRDVFEVRAQLDFLNGPNAIDVAIFQGDFMVTEMKFEEFRDRPVTKPTLSGRDGRDFLQAALNCAWELGLRPPGLEHTTETIAATARHLEDMRAITFAKLNVEKPR